MLRRLVTTFAVVTNLLLLDQIVKEAAVRGLKGRGALEVLPGVFNLAYVENRGCAWGLLQGHVWPLAVFACAALAFLVWKRASFFPKGFWGACAETLLYAGIVGNLVDRLARGFVVDMFDFHWGPHHFPVFNVADSYITVSAFLLLVFAWLDDRREKAAKRALSAARAADRGDGPA